MKISGEIIYHTVRASLDWCGPRLVFITPRCLGRAAAPFKPPHEASHAYDGAARRNKSDRRRAPRWGKA